MPAIPTERNITFSQMAAISYFEDIHNLTDVIRIGGLGKTMHRKGKLKINLLTSVPCLCRF